MRLSALPHTRPLTVEEYDQLDSDLRYELICGELVPMPPMPGEIHGAVTNRFAIRAGSFVEENDLGECFAAETRFLIARNPDTARAPDWAFIAKSRLSETLAKGSGHVVPDIILEVRSPSDKEENVLDKIQAWLSAGVKIAWELNPQPQILTVYRAGREPQTLGIDGTLTGEEVLPGFTLSLRRLFANLNFEA